MTDPEVASPPLKRARLEALSRPPYVRNEVNESQLGKEFELNVAIYSLLTLPPGKKHAVGFEVLEAPAKFDDIVISVQRSNDYEYYCRQAKHRDTEKNPGECLTWNALLHRISRKLTFCIPRYFESWQKTQSSTFSLSKVRELAFVTTYSLAQTGRNPNTSPSVNLEHLAEKLYAAGKNYKTEHCITGSDLRQYFEELIDSQETWRPPTDDQRSYKFSENAVTAIINGTGKALNNASSATYLKEYETFLRLLVFRVSMPHVTKLKAINQSISKLFLPFYSDFVNNNYDSCLVEKFKQLFNPLTGTANTACQAGGSGRKVFADWATVGSRCSIFENLANFFKHQVSIKGSTENYETDVLVNYYEQFKLEKVRLVETLPWTNEEMSNLSIAWQENKTPLHVSNIYSNVSNATVLSLNIISTIKRSKYNKEHAWRTLIVQVEDEKGILNVVDYFKTLDAEVSKYKELIRMKFCCIIEVSPFFQQADKSNEYAEKMARDLIALSEVRRWIKFVLITNLPLSAVSVLHDLKCTEGVPFEWKDLTSDGKKFLFEKTLYLEEDKQTTLQKLGFKEEPISKWFMSQQSLLAELIIHKKERPLSLGLPKKDQDLNVDYIEREVQLPLVKKRKMEEKALQFTFNEEDYIKDEAKYLLIRACTKGGNEVFLLVKSKEPKSTLKLKNDIVNSRDSDLTVEESRLLEDNVNFGTGSNDNKLIVVVDYPGKGKSCLLTSISNRFLDEWDNQSTHHCLLLRVDLLRIKGWEEYRDRPMDLFFTHSLSCGNRSEKSSNADLNENIVKEKCLSASEPGVFVLLDGFDEISDKQRQITLGMVDHLLLDAKGIKRIILTSRPEDTLENELEQHFGQYSLHLKNFDRQDQIKYLMKRWCAELEKCDKQIGSEDKIESFIKALVDYADQALIDENRTFLEIPLQCMILSTCFFSQLVQYLDGKSTLEFKDENFELLHLYERFAEVKFDFMFTEKAGLQWKNEASIFARSILKGRCLKSLMRLSVFHMMGIDDAQHVCGLSWVAYSNEANVYDEEKGESKYSEDLQIAMKLGFLHGLSVEKCQMPDSQNLNPNNIKFLHRTFAEYFFASLILSHITKKVSKLFGDAPMPIQVIKRERVSDERPNEILMSQPERNQSFEIITKKILEADEYAGVRRFLDRMLAKHLPPAADRCPFATESRSDAVEKWTVLGHEMFNKHLAEFAISLVADLFAKWQRDGLDNVDLEKCTRHLIDDLRSLMRREQTPEAGSDHSDDHSEELLQREQPPEVGLAGILHGEGGKQPCITLLLLHCIKAHACRPDTSDLDREKLAHFFALTVHKWICEDEDHPELISSMIHLLDRVTGLSPEKNNIFSKWFFILVNTLSKAAKMLENPSLSALGSACEMLKSHSDAKNFEENVRLIATSLIDNDNTGTTEGGTLLKLSKNTECYENKNKPFKRILNGLSAIDSLEDFQVRNLADWFVAELSRQRALIDEKFKNLMPIMLRRDEDFKMSRWNELHIMNPCFVGEAVEFFMENATKLPETVTTLDTILDDALEYLSQSRTLLYADNHLRDIMIFIRKLNVKKLNRFLEKEAPEGLANFYEINDERISISAAALFDKTSTLNVTFWNSLLTYEIIRFSSDKEINRKNIMQDEIERQCLIAFTHAGCCCQCQGDFYTGFGIHFPYEIFHLEETREEFSEWFAFRLKLVWEENGEIELIDFLFKGVIRSTELSQESELQIEMRDAIRSSRNPTQSELGSFLTGIDLAKLPCLLFSDMFSELVLKRLSSDGWRHLEQTLKDVPLFTCHNGCFDDDVRDLPSVTDCKMSLWEGIMQEDDASNEQIFTCKSKFEQIKALQERLQQTMPLSPASSHRETTKS